MPKQAVLLLAHGTPETIEEIPDYLRNVVSGRPLPEQVIEEIKHMSLDEQAEVIQFAVGLARTRQLTAQELAAC